MVVVDAGDSLMVAPKTAMDERSLTQRQLKATLIADSFALAEIDAMALGAMDWTLGGDWVRALVRDKELPVLAANLTCGGEAPFPASRVVERAGRRFGIIGVTAGEVEGCEVGDPIPAIRSALDALGEVDVSVALLPARTKPDVATFGLADLPIDIGFDARGQHTRASGERSGKTWMFGAGKQGKSLGILSLQFTPGATTWEPTGQLAEVEQRIDRLEQRLAATRTRMESTEEPSRKTLFERQISSYQVQLDKERAQAAELAGRDVSGNLLENSEVQLSRAIANHEATEALVLAAKEKIGEEQVTTSPNTAPHRIPEGPYAGSDACAQCHRAEFLQWSRTPHARAFQTLFADKRHLDDDCYSCHVTGAGQPGGPASPVEVRGFRDVQCEACHGPGRAHTEDVGNAELRPVADPGEAVCVTCHDGDKDGGRFEFPHYRPKIVHKPPG